MATIGIRPHIPVCPPQAPQLSILHRTLDKEIIIYRTFDPLYYYVYMMYSHPHKLPISLSLSIIHLIASHVYPTLGT